MTEEQGPNMPFREALPKPEVLFPNTMKRLGKSPDRAAAFEQATTVEGLRGLAESRTAYMLSYMTDPATYQPGDHFAFNGLLKPQLEGRELIDAYAFWEALDPMRRLVALDAIGKTVGVDINQEAANLRGAVQLGRTEVHEVTIPTKMPLFDVRLRYQESEKDKIFYMLVKKAEVVILEPTSPNTD